MTGSGSRTKPPKTAIMIERRRGDHAAALAVARHDRLARRRPVCDEVLAHAGHEEHLVVHREPEQDPDQQHRQEARRSARPWRRRTGRPGCRPGRPRRRAPIDARDAEQEAGGRLDRHEDRAEHDHQQQQREPDDDRDVLRQRGAELVGGVDVQRRRAGDVRVDAGRLAGSRRPCRACTTTRSLVSSDAGPLVGVTETIVRSPASF